MKRIIALLTAAVLTVSLAACSAGERGGESITLWFPSVLTGDLSAEPFVREEIAVGRNEDKVTAAMRALLNGTEQNASPYAEGVEINAIKYQSNSVIIDFNAEYFSMTGVELAAAEACAALTLCGIEDIYGVGFTVGGVSYGSGAYTMLGADDIVTGDLSLKPIEREITVCFSDGNAHYVVGETRNVVLRENALLERYVLDELIKGPNDSSLRSTLPEDTTIIGVSNENSVCYVNFSGEFAEIFDMPIAQRIQTIIAVTNSLCEVENVNCVQYYVEGEKLFDTPIYENELAMGKFADEAIDCTVYLPGDDGKNVVGVTMRVETAGGFDLNRLLCEKLVTGIDGNGFMSALPRGTRVNNVSVEDGVAVIDFSGEFIRSEPPGGISRALMENTIALTLSATNEGVSAVTLLVDGEPYDGGRIFRPIYDNVTE